MLQRLLLITITLCSLTASAQWQQTGSKVRYVTGIGIPTKDTAAGVLADSSQILIRPADSSLYVKYKRTWMRVGGGGGSIAGSGTFNYIPKFTGTSSIGNSLIYDDGSLIGIGTATPNSFLDVRGSATFKITSPRILIEDNDNNGTASIWFRPQNASFNTRGAIDLISAGSGAAGEFRFSAGATGGTGNAAHYMSFYTAAIERMRINQSGNVGIGTTNPSVKLQSNISTSGLPATSGTTQTNGALRLSSTATSGILDFGINSSNNWIQSTDATDLSQIYNLLLNPNGGNVGIGTTSPAAKLSVQGTTLINTNTDNGTDKLQVNGSATINNQFQITGNGTKINWFSSGFENWYAGTRTSSTQFSIGSQTTADALILNNNGSAQFVSSVTSTQFRLSSLNTAPASATAAGTTGEIRIDANYIYICTATNTWKRVAIATW